MAMDIIVSVAAKIAEYMVAPISRQCGYILYYKGNVERLKPEVQTLKGNKDSVQHYADQAKRNGEEIENNVQNWLNKVDVIVAEAEKLIDSEDHAKAECCTGHFPNLWTRHQLSRKIKKMTQEISKVLVEGKFDRISYRPASQVTVTPFGRGYEALDSRTSMLNEIMQALKDTNLYIIGVYGMGGVGKTTLVKELAWQAEKGGSFGAVVLATITDSPNVEKIQGQIADALDLTFNKETKEGRARQLSQRISKEKSILVILDDIWGKLDLTEVGIPFGDDHKVCKLVVTSRDLNVLNSEMGIQKEFRLEVLHVEDSWNLFEKMAGDVVQEFNIKPIAVEVAKCCAGLPLLIVTVAKALRKKDASYWNSTLNELKRFDQEGLHKKVYSTLELSYNCLESDELKSLFLFFGSFGENDLPTAGIFTYYWGLGLYRNVCTMTEARNRYYNLIKDLRASSLLLDAEFEYIEMHDFVRDVAKSIASRAQPTYAVQRHTEIKQWPKIDQLQKCHFISMPDSYIHELPEKLACPELKLLSLLNAGKHLNVPENFFSRMKEVKVMEFRRMMFTPSLPLSLSLLTKLRSLELSECVLEDISMVGELKSLEILGLERSDIKELPKEIGQLANLRMLNLTRCSKLRFIPTNLISSLTCLEELYMGNCSIQWDVKGIDGKSNHASIDELRNLSQLTTLDIMIQDASVLPRDLLQVLANLERYNIYIGDNWKWSSKWSTEASESSKTLKLMQKSTSNLLDNGFNLLLNVSEDISFAGLQSVRDVLYDLNKEGFPQLKHLQIQCSAELKYILNSMARVHLDPAFPNLETLALQNLVNLEEICHGPIPKNSFTKLQNIKVEGCDKLKSLLCHSLIKDLPQLLEIKISKCKLMTKIIDKKTPEIDEVMDMITFPKLHSLTLECLPSLVSFCPMPKTTYTQSLELFDQKGGMPCLETLTLSMINSCKLWDGKLHGHSCIQNLRTLTIDNCGSISYVFSPSVARELVNLQCLKISNCQKLEEIVVLDEKLGNTSSDQKSFSNEEVIFPNLETLVIFHMDHLKSIWHNQLAPNSFCKLKKLETKYCNKLLNVIPLYVLNKLQNLETMIVINCPALEVVFEIQGLEADAGRQTRLKMQLSTLTLERLPMLKHIWSGNHFGSIKFQNLCKFEVTECKSLNHVFPLLVAKELRHLQSLWIVECGMENIVAQDEMDDANLVPIFVFPELTSLEFRNLPQLRSFYNGLHTLDCPILRELDVFHCDHLELFTSKSVDGQPLLLVEKVIPNISELILNSKDVTKLRNSQLSDDLIHTVKALHLRCFHDESDKFPSGFFKRFINLERLTVACSSFTEIFSIGSFGSGPSVTTMKLRRLVLAQLKNLRFICEDKSEMQPVLQNLAELWLYRCSRLRIIVPSWMLFQNLQELWVEDCAGLENIFTPAAATSLLKLQNLRILDCEKVEEIVASNDDSDAGDLAFMKLKHLELRNLPRLRSFCKESYNFKFPLLEKLYVVDCHMMETFSYGALSAPQLREVRHTFFDLPHWDGDLNTTIQKKFSETNSKDD